MHRRNEVLREEALPAQRSILAASEVVLKASMYGSQVGFPHWVRLSSPIALVLDDAIPKKGHPVALINGRQNVPLVDHCASKLG